MATAHISTIHVPSQSLRVSRPVLHRAHEPEAPVLERAMLLPARPLLCRPRPHLGRKLLAPAVVDAPLLRRLLRAPPAATSRRFVAGVLAVGPRWRLAALPLVGVRRRQRRLGSRHSSLRPLQAPLGGVKLGLEELPLHQQRRGRRARRFGLLDADRVGI